MLVAVDTTPAMLEAGASTAVACVGTAMPVGIKSAFQYVVNLQGALFQKDTYLP